MAANAFVVTMVMRNATGQRQTLTLTISDVAAADAIFPDGSGQNTLSKYDVWITDLICSEAGEDTTHFDMYVGGVLQTRKVYYGNNQYNAVIREVQQNPIRVPAGQIFRLIQRA